MKLHKASFDEMIRRDFGIRPFTRVIYFKGDSLGASCAFFWGSLFFLSEARNSLLHLNLVVWIPNFIDFHLLFMTKEDPERHFFEMG